MTKNLKAASILQLSNKYLFVTILLSSIISVQAQQITPAVSEAINYNYSKDGIFIDMSIGEFAITTLATPKNIITQGFLQPISIEQPCVTPDLFYYPNPVLNILTLGAIDCEVYIHYVETYDLFGKEVLLTLAENNMVDLSTIGIGVYILRAYAESGELIGTVKIIKTTV